MANLAHGKATRALISRKNSMVASLLFYCAFLNSLYHLYTVNLTSSSELLSAKSLMKSFLKHLSMKTSASLLHLSWTRNSELLVFWRLRLVLAHGSKALSFLVVSSLKSLTTSTKWLPMKRLLVWVPLVSLMVLPLVLLLVCLPFSTLVLPHWRARWVKLVHIKYAPFDTI